ncbi:MAG TPA: flavodoxin [Candidatus Caccenecus avistercoris]|nr:flavodoxin [Candidatus Caccenecus avistercoris]
MKLIAYFSRADENYTSDGIKKLSVGNTEVVANIIHDLTGADLFKIEPVKSYPKDYHETTHLAQIELNNNARPAIKNKLTNTEEYDIIYLGYPNWWGTMPMVVLTFLESINLTGKIIKPFCTHEGSGMGNSESNLKSYFPDAIIKK